MYKYDKYCEKRFSRRRKKILEGVSEYLLTLLHPACGLGIGIELAAQFVERFKSFFIAESRYEFES